VNSQKVIQSVSQIQNSLYFRVPRPRVFKSVRSLLTSRDFPIHRSRFMFHAGEIQIDAEPGLRPRTLSLERKIRTLRKNREKGGTRISVGHQLARVIQPTIDSSRSFIPSYASYMYALPASRRLCPHLCRKNNSNGGRPSKADP
jgi:hypothetical protein